MFEKKMSFIINIKKGMQKLNKLKKILKIYKIF